MTFGASILDEESHGNAQHYPNSGAHIDIPDQNETQIYLSLS